MSATGLPETAAPIEPTGTGGQEARLRYAMDAGRVGAWDLDVAGTQLQCSATCKAHFGLPPDSGFGFAEWKAAVFRADWPIIKQTAQRAIDDAGEFAVEYRVRWPDRTWHWIETRGRIDGNGAHLSGVTLDITDRKRAEHLAREQTRLLEMIATGLSHDPCMQALCEAVTHLEPDARSCVVLADGDGRRIAAVHVAGLPMSFGETLAGLSVEHIAPCADVATDTLPSPVLRELCTRNEIRSLHCAPVVDPNGHTAGWFVLALSEARESDAWVQRICDFGANVARIILERERTVSRVLHNEAQLAEDLADARLLQEISAEIVREPDEYALSCKILDTAIILMHSQFGSFQLLERREDGPLLHLHVNRGFSDEAATHWRQVRMDTGCVCGDALREGRRIIVPDISTFIEDPVEREVYARAGIRAVQTTPLRTRDGRLVGMLSTHWSRAHHPSQRELDLLDVLARLAADLVERRQSEAALRDSEAAAERQHRLYEAILTNTPDLAYVFDREHRFIYANDVLLRMWGKSWAEAIGKTCLELGYEPWHAQMHDREIEEVIATRMPVRGEVPFNGTFGRRMYDYIFVPVLNAHGEVEAIAGTTRDVTDRRNAEETLRNHSAQVDALLEAAPLGIYLLDSAFRIRHVNPIARPALGDAVGRDFAEVISGLSGQERARELLAIFHRTLHTGEPFIALEYPDFQSDRGVTEYYDWRAHRIVLPDGGFGVVCYFQEVTAQVQARRAIEASRDALREEDARKDEFLTTLAHELRNPLGPLSNCLQIMRLRDIDDEEGRRLRSMMERQLAQLIHLVDDLLEVSRITGGKIELRRAPVDLRSVIATALETAHPLIQAGGHQVRVSIESEPLLLDVDAVRLAQVFTNLLNNAAKYTPPGGRIQVEAVSEDGQVRICVRDNGIGLPSEMRERVFDRFTQSEHSRRHSQGGLGIGLTIVRSLVAMHGGSVAALSEGIGRGSEFVVYLPRIASGAVAGPTPQAVPLAHGRSSILVVDDNHENADSLAEFLRCLGHDVRTCYDGAAAVAAVSERVPDVVLIDLGMPGMDGFETCRCIRAMNGGSGIRIIAVTGWGQEADVQRTARSGFDAHMVKPVDPHALIDQLEAFRSRSPGAPV
ncbi:PAS domain-containing protein [Lysobacter sp. LF1]|uniref:histidine kinase n=1 Tax=Lysobacter stagni TaxID=3045172 RepID=A0ABT6XI36_9GAMM|nr:ATP-binding protein [Lysobacter sp. LF1]MDI9239812.1 PAS domain-containing protein [Lysobacter sp. LF1]